MSDDEQPPPDAPVEPRAIPGAFVISERTVAVVATLLAVASLTTLVTVSAIKDVDGLSTIALALAVFAFAAQLIITIAQGNATTRQLQLAQEVQLQTSTMLAGIQATADVTAGLFERVIERWAAETADGQGGPPAPEELEAREDRLRELLEEEIDKSAPYRDVVFGPSPAGLTRDLDGQVRIIRDAVDMDAVGRVLRNLAASKGIRKPPLQRNFNSHPAAPPPAEEDGDG